MFSSKHAIWQFAYAGDELDDWLSYAEGLVRKWSVQNSNEIAFQNTFDIILAALLLKDDLLPDSARAALAEVMLNTISEAGINKFRIKCLHIEPPKPGRKKARSTTGHRLSEVYSLLKKGVSTTQAYKVVAEMHFKSPDTIRREYERHFSEERKRKEAGENDK